MINDYGRDYRLLPVEWLHNIWRPDSFFKNAKQVIFLTMMVEKKTKTICTIIIKIINAMVSSSMLPSKQIAENDLRFPDYIFRVIFPRSYLPDYFPRLHFHAYIFYVTFSRLYFQGYISKVTFPGYLFFQIIFSTLYFQDYIKVTFSKFYFPGYFSRLPLSRLYFLPYIFKMTFLHFPGYIFYVTLS